MSLNEICLLFDYKLDINFLLRPQKWLFSLSLSLSLSLSAPLFFKNALLVSSPSSDNFTLL